MEDILSVLEEDPCCSVCGQIFNIPVVLCCILCERCFCEICCQQFLEMKGFECPFCREEISESGLGKCKEQKMKVLNIAQHNSIINIKYTHCVNPNKGFLNQQNKFIHWVHFSSLYGFLYGSCLVCVGIYVVIYMSKSFSRGKLLIPYTSSMMLVSEFFSKSVYLSIKILTRW